MAMKIGAHQLAKFKSKAESMMKRANGVKAKTEGIVNTVVHSAEVGVAAFAMGALNGRYGGVEVAGVPVDLGGALALHALGFMGVAGKSSAHVHALGDGLLASYASTLGKGVGVSWREKSLRSSSVQGARLSAAELRALAGKGDAVEGAEIEGDTAPGETEEEEAERRG
jgi:hypothetical protein